MARNKNIHLYNIDSVFSEFDKYLKDSKFNKFVELSESENLNDEYIELTKKFRDKFNIDEFTNNRDEFVKIVKEKLFNEFLENNKISTVYGEQLYSVYNNESEFDFSEAINEFKTRRHKPKTRLLVKKILTPLAITLGVAAGTIGAVALAGLTAGSSLGFIPIFTSLGKTAQVITSVALTAGAIATPVVIGVKNKIVKAHYNHKYETANENFKRLYLEQTSLKDLPIADLMNKITETNHKIADSKNPISKFFMRMKNKNRLKHLSKTTQDLMNMYLFHEKCTDIPPEQKVNKLNCLHDILNSVDEFVQNDVQETKHCAIITAKSTKDHKIKPITVENMDIYADLQMTLRRDSADVPEREKPKKHSKFTVNHLRDQHIEARNILSDGKTFIQKLISKWKIEQVEQQDEHNNPVLDDSGNTVLKPKAVKVEA